VSCEWCQPPVKPPMGSWDGALSAMVPVGAGLSGALPEPSPVRFDDPDTPSVRRIVGANLRLAQSWRLLNRYSPWMTLRPTIPSAV